MRSRFEPSLSLDAAERTAFHGHHPRPEGAELAHRLRLILRDLRAVGTREHLAGGLHIRDQMLTPEEVIAALRSHLGGKRDGPVVSAYRSPSANIRFYVMTSADRSVTTVFLPDEARL
jgi:hypothetical protein